MAKKIQLNSAYGALGNEYFRWFDMNNTESITKGGQLSIRWAENAINKLLNKTDTFWRPPRKSARLGSARLGSARLGSARRGSARLGSAARFLMIF